MSTPAGSGGASPAGPLSPHNEGPIGQAADFFPGAVPDRDPVPDRDRHDRGDKHRRGC